MNQRKNMVHFKSKAKEKKMFPLYKPNLTLFQDNLWSDYLQVNNDQTKTLASTTSSKSNQVDSTDSRWEDNLRAKAITEILNIDSGSPWDYYNYNTFKNGRYRRIDTAKKIWVNSEAAYAEVEQLRIRFLVNTLDYSDDDKDNASEPHSREVLLHQSLHLLKIYQNIQSPQHSFLKIKKKKKKVIFVYEFRTINFTDFIIGSIDENIYNENSDSVTNTAEIKKEYQSSQNNEITQKEESCSQEFTDLVDMREVQDIIKDGQNITENQRISILNVIEQPFEIGFKLSDMVKLVTFQTNRLRFSDLVEQPPEGFVLELSDLIKPQKRR